ncbi:WGR domain-containing protein, partial [Bernardetia sp.]|uniref:WGR domain-containing protein n=1 Tax=Bernardetia sp. TaxID=1937974 RepID=UPI0025C1AE18
MKLIEQSKLYFKEGNSDKVYEIDLCEVGGNLYVVNFRYGKRGANLKEGTKTPAPVSRPKAQAVFTALETEKTKKGYQKQADTNEPKEKEFPSSISSKEEAILQRLREDVQKAKSSDGNVKSIFKTEWKTGRVAWQVGEVKLKSATPLLIELLEKDDNLETIDIYSILWALVRCEEEKAVSFFKHYENDKNIESHIQKIAIEGLLTIGNKKEETAKKLFDSLPPTIQEFVRNQSIREVKKEIQQRIAEKQKDFQFLETLYLLVHSYPFLQKTVLETLSELPLRPPFFKYIRSIYKLAELREDVRILGLLSYRFEKNSAMYRSTKITEDSNTNNWYYQYRVRRYIPEINQQIRDITKEVKNKNSKIGYSEQTRAYFQRRDLRRLKDIAINDENHNYVKLATSILLSYQKQDYQTHFVSRIGYSAWDRSTRKYTHNFVIYPENSSSLLLNLILNGQNKELELVDKKWRKKEKVTVVSNNWYAQPPAQKEKLSTLKRINVFNKRTQQEQKERFKRTEFFPEKWDALPEAYIQLLAEAKLDMIHEFAYKNLKRHDQYEELVAKFDVKLLKKLLASESQIPAFFGVEICKEKLEQNFDKELTLLLLNSKVEEGRKLAQEIIEKNASSFTEDVNFTLFVSELIFNQYADIRSWVNEFLQKITLSSDKWKIVVGKAISEMLGTNNSEDQYYSTEILKDAQNVLKTNAKTVLENVGWNIVLELLEDKILQNQVFASDILLIKSKLIKATDIPFSILNGFFESNSEKIRANGMEIFSNYPASFLLEAHELLGNMLVSPHQNLRSSAREIVIKLVQDNVNQNSKEGKEFAESIVTKLVVSLRKKDPEEIKIEELSKLQNVNNSERQSNVSSLVQPSVHKEIAKLLINHFDKYLAQITLKTTLNLLHGNYREGQFVGFHILKNHIVTNKEKEEISMRQLVALANHELLEIRHWTLEYYQNTLARIRYEREESLRILDAKWDDVREKAMAFFRENFTESDWDVDSLVSIADSVRPDVEAFGKELITKFFKNEDGEKYLTMLSQHPSNSMQLFATNYLERFATGNLKRLKEMEFYFRCVLMQVNKGRIAKNRVLDFLEKEAFASKETAFWLVPLLND